MYDARGEAKNNAVLAISVGVPNLLIGPMTIYSLNPVAEAFAAPLEKA
jgi:hypothetical protein